MWSLCNRTHSINLQPRQCCFVTNVRKVWECVGQFLFTGATEEAHCESGTGMCQLLNYRALFIILLGSAFTCTSTIEGLSITWHPFFTTDDYHQHACEACDLVPFSRLDTQYFRGFVSALL